MADLFEAFEADVLGYDPFSGDFGHPSDHVFFDRIVRAAKPHCGCHTCGGDIEAGERHRHAAGKFDGEFMAWRWCWACCVAMARAFLPWLDPAQPAPDTEINQREALRWSRERAA